MPIIHLNSHVQKMVKSKLLTALFKKHKFSELIDLDLASKIYYNFAKEQAYKDYLLGDQTDQDTERILLELFKFCRASENFVELLEDQYVNWDDDKSIVIGSIKKIIKNLKSDTELDLKPYDPDHETVKDFGETLLNRTFTDDESLLEKIEPVLKNWDSDRVAIIDLIFLKMALCELIMFETIPSKVTLNEYVELAKLYSTPKSKEFINGVLDTLVADLTASKEIVKKGRGLVD
jgi:N utilization substance protein B